MAEVNGIEPSPITQWHGFQDRFQTFWANFLLKFGGADWIRTNSAFASDLQSDVTLQRYRRPFKTGTPSGIRTRLLIIESDVS